MDLLHENVSRDHVELDVFQERVKNLKINKLITNFNYVLQTLRLFWAELYTQGPIQLLRKGLFLIVNEKNSDKKNMNVYNTLSITITLQYVSETLQISWKKYVINACSTTGKPTRSFATERVSLDSV